MQISLGDKNKKRILIFLVIPLLLAISLFIEDFTLKIISGLILIIYVGFIIFLRDSVSKEFYSDNEPNNSDEEEKVNVTPAESSDPAKLDVDFGEEIKIISGNKKVEVLSTPELYAGNTSSKKTTFKSPELKRNFNELAKEEIPKGLSYDEEFGFILERILHAVKDSFNAYSAIFFWYNPKKKKLTLERFISSSKAISKQKFDLENDILSKIVVNEEPEQLTDITPNAERDVIRYYTTPQGIRSFLGVPLYYGKILSGVLVIDSKNPEAFGLETVYSLGKFVRVISLFLSIFDEKYNDNQAEDRLKGLLNFLNTEEDFGNYKTVYESLENSIKYLLNWDVFTFVMFDSIDRKFKTAKIINKTSSLKYIGENLIIDLAEKTVVANSIRNGSPVKIDDASIDDVKRYSKSEDINFDGSFLAIPLVYKDQVYGVLCFENLKKSFYTNSDIQFIKNATKIFSFIIYSFSTQNLLRSLLSVDIETKALNYNSFIEQLSADLVKAKEVNVSGVLVLIKIDDFLEQETLFEGDPLPKVVQAVADMIREEMTPLNLFGRIGNKLFAIHFFNFSTKDIFLWSEKLRIKIARKPIVVGLKQTTFTVSIGVASTQEKLDVNEVLHNAELALTKALEKGGNSVKSIN